MVQTSSVTCHLPHLQPAAGMMQACQGNVEQATTLLQQHMPSLAQLTSELAVPAAEPGTVSLRSATAQHYSSLAVDLERNGVASDSNQASISTGAAQKLQVDSSSNKHVLLPAGVRSLHQSPPALTAVNKQSTCRSRSTSPPSVQHPKSSAQSAYTYSSGASDGETGLYDTRQHACVRGSGVAQLLHDEVLQTADPVAAAVDEAGRVVEEKSRMKSMADQERQALSLHTQARDTFFAAAQVAYEKGMLLTTPVCPWLVDPVDCCACSWHSFKMQTFDSCCQPPLFCHCSMHAWLCMSVLLHLPRLWEK